MCPQHDRAAKVVADDEGRLQLPTVQQPGQHPVLPGEGDILPRIFLGLAVAGQIVKIDGPPPGQGRNEVTPVKGGPGGAVHQHQRRSLPGYIVGYLTARGGEFFA